MRGYTMRNILAAAVAGVFLAGSAANATTYTYTLPEYDGDGNLGLALVGIWDVILGSGESIVSALFTSSFGNSVVNSSAQGAVLVNGIVVATCDGPGNSCWEGPGELISYSFVPAEFGNLLGTVSVFYDQTGCCVIRLGETTLTIETAASQVPLPAGGFLLIGALGGLAALRRRHKLA